MTPRLTASASPVVRSGLTPPAVLALCLWAGVACAAAPAEVIEDFDRAPLGPPARGMKLTPSQAATEYTVEIAGGGERGTRCLLLKAVPARAGWTRWILARTRNLKGRTGLRFAARADRPVQLRATLEGGGKLYWSGTIGAGWTTVDLPFEELPGNGLFLPEKFSALTLTAAHDDAAPVEVRVDSIAAVRGPAGRRTSVGFSLMTPPPDWKDEGGSTYGIVWGGYQEGVRLWSFFTDSEAYVPASRLGLTWATLPHLLTGRTGLAVVLRIAPAQPACLVRLGLTEAEGERFLALRDAPGEFGEIFVPFDAFVPDAGNNLTLAAEHQNGRLDLGSVTGWQLDLVPVTEQPVHGKLFVREAWAVSR